MAMWNISSNLFIFGKKSFLQLGRNSVLNFRNSVPVTIWDALYDKEHCNRYILANLVKSED
jgi:hypothetical protein